MKGAESNGLVWHLHQVTLSENDDNGFIGVQFDAFGEQESGMPTVELHHAFGFRSMARDPDVDSDGEIKQGCQVQIAEDGDERHAWLAGDARFIASLPRGTKGGSHQYGVTANGAKGVSFASFDGDTGSYTLYCPEFSGSGAVSGAHMISIDVTNRAIELVHADGFAVMLTKDGIQMRGDDSTWMKLGKGLFEVVAAQIKLRGIVAIGADTSAALPLLPGVATQPTPSVFFSPV
jgi:hypothetical protein